MGNNRRPFTSLNKADKTQQLRDEEDRGERIEPYSRRSDNLPDEIIHNNAMVKGFRGLKRLGKMVMGKENPEGRRTAAERKAKGQTTLKKKLF